MTQKPRSSAVLFVPMIGGSRHGCFHEWEGSNTFTSNRLVAPDGAVFSNSDAALTYFRLHQESLLVDIYKFTQYHGDDRALHYFWRHSSLSPEVAFKMLCEGDYVS